MKEKINPYEYLCVYDKRSPDYNPEHQKSTTEGCFCDNCFKGSHILALEIIRLKEKLPIDTGEITNSFRKLCETRHDELTALHAAIQTDVHTFQAELSAELDMTIDLACCQADMDDDSDTPEELQEMVDDIARMMYGYFEWLD